MQRTKWKKSAKILLFSTIGLLVTSIGLFTFLKDTKVAFGIIPVLITFIAYRIFITKYKNKRVYNYWYTVSSISKRKDVG